LQPCWDAGLDGIKNKIDPAKPWTKNLYDLPAEELAISQRIGSLRASADETAIGFMDYLLAR